MVSVIIPVYNQAKKLIETLDSLMKQTYKEIEVIIVNDASKDGVEKVFSKYIEKQETNIDFFFFNQEKNQGAPIARNLGFSKSKGEYVFFCDADAVLKENALEEMRKALEQKNDCSYVFSSFMWGKKLFKVGEFDPEKLRKGPYIHTMSLIRREVLNDNPWDEGIKKFQDWDLYLTLLEQGNVGCWIDKVLFIVKPGGTMSSWLPSFCYKYLPFLPQVKKYNQAMKIIKEKHNLV